MCPAASSLQLSGPWCWGWALSAWAGCWSLCQGGEEGATWGASKTFFHGINESQELPGEPTGAGRCVWVLPAPNASARGLLCQGIMRAVLWLGAAGPAGSRHGRAVLPQPWLLLRSALLTQKVSPRFSLVGYSTSVRPGEPGGVSICCVTGRRKAIRASLSD